MEENLPPVSSSTGDCPLGSLENPVRVNGIEGMHDYLQRLLTLAHKPLFFHRLGKTTEKNGDPVNVYELIAQDNSGRWVLAISRHYHTTSREAPEGLWLDPKSHAPDSSKHPYTEITIGVDQFVKNFPMKLPRGFRKVSGGMSSSALLEYVESVLSRFTPDEWCNQPFQKILATTAEAHRSPSEINWSESFGSIPQLKRRSSGVRFTCCRCGHPHRRPFFVETNFDSSPIIWG